MCIQKLNQAFGPMVFWGNNPHQAFDHHNLQIQSALGIDGLCCVLAGPAGNGLCNLRPVGRGLSGHDRATAEFTVPDTHVVGTQVTKVGQAPECKKPAKVCIVERHGGCIAAIMACLAFRLKRAALIPPTPPALP